MTINPIPISKVRKGAAYLATGDGKAIPLDTDSLQRVFQAISTPKQTDLITTGEAARILGVSVKTVTRMLDAGEIPFIRYNARGNRMVERSKVTSYRDQSQFHSKQALDEMRAAANEGGLDDINYREYLDKFE